MALSNVFLTDFLDPDELYVVLFKKSSLQTARVNWTDEELKSPRFHYENDDNTIRGLGGTRTRIKELSVRSPFIEYAIGKLKIIDGVFEVVEILK